LTEQEQVEISRIVGPGAVIFFDLKAKRMKDVIFDWKEILNFEGDSGPYLQYTYVRLGSLLDKAAQEGFEFSRATSPRWLRSKKRFARILWAFRPLWKLPHATMSRR